MSGAALEALTAEGLAAWHGLPPGLPPEAFAPALAIETEVLGMADLGLRKALFRGGTLTAAGITVRVWVTPDESETLALDFLEAPTFAPTGAAWREALGEPVRLDTYRGTVPKPGAEWVWPQRGAVAFVNPETDATWRALLFPAGDQAAYENGFRLEQRATRRPARRF